MLDSLTIKNNVELLLVFYNKNITTNGYTLLLNKLLDKS